MLPDEYIGLAYRTVAGRIPEDVLSTVDQRVLHGLLGLISELGGLANLYKEDIFYGKLQDKYGGGHVTSRHLVEELGDILWYIALLCRANGLSLEDIMERNIAKLRVRYPKGFDTTDALVRDRESEAEALKGTRIKPEEGPGD